jgi:putative polyhydroxyalkanoate system protein
MPDIRIVRAHQLGLTQARELALQWADQATDKFQLTCTHQQGDASHEVSFRRSGIQGRLRVTGELFEMDASLGFLFGAFRERIEQEVAHRLDKLLEQLSAVKPAADATDTTRSCP